MVEFILEDVARVTPLNAIALRYFNPIGADLKLRSGATVERPTHVLGRMLDAANGHIPQFEITGTEYNTRDGSGMRDFIHVHDVAMAHVRAVEHFDDILDNSSEGYTVINLGTGRGTTVKELLGMCMEATGMKFPVVEAPARPGDVAGVYANCSKAERQLGWHAEHSITEAIRHHQQWLEKRATLLKY